MAPKAFLMLILAALLSLTAQLTTARAAGPALCQTNCATAIVPPVAASPFGITSGPHGSEWFSLDDAVGRIDQRGVVTVYPVPTANANAGWLTTDPSGAVWFSERDTGKIGRITPNGSITEFALPSSDAVPQGIVMGPDGNLYIAEQGANAIARLTPATGQVREFPVTTLDSAPLGLALGSDGALWFTERSADKVVRMTLDGTFTEYPLTPGAFPNRIVAAPDGALWFTELLAGKIGRITTNGVLTEFPIAGGPVGITVGKDGQLYVDLAFAPGVDRVNLAGAVTGHWDLPGGVETLQIATGSGLDLWVTDTFGGKIYHVTPYSTGQ
jgi:virginiamycin B lyase